ncbi:MAG: selenocysteine-specific translation elongation factor [Clostridiaceae bacterium]|nr:selenocysteine-specific translation elongation factor [Clostridiaceae bacterium]
MKNIVIGTAGHIDHGKTTLIKALTGRETDRLKEEKKRGISIELGFTYFDLPSGRRAGIIDVPGHEKFIRHMLAGAGGMDIVMLVIAADEGVMPQTKEHLDILSLLKIEKGVIVITKSNLVDREWLELIKEDIREKVKGTFFENAELLTVDSVEGIGIDDLIKTIDRLTDETESRDVSSPARMPIDRVFTVTGFGTVVTGTLMEGQIAIEDTLEILPEKIKVRIRNIQVHGKSVDRAFAGQRVAINLANTKKEDIERGYVLTATGAMETTMMIDAKLKVLGDMAKEIENRTRVRLYHGSTEVFARVVILEKDKLQAGDLALVQLRLEESIAVKKGDRIVVRSYSPMETIGGAVVIDGNPEKHKRFDKTTIEELLTKEKGNPQDLLEKHIDKYSSEFPNISFLAKISGEHIENIRVLIKQLDEKQKILMLNDSTIIHRNYYESIKDKGIEILKKYHEKNSLKVGISKEEFKSRLLPHNSGKLGDIILEFLEEEKMIKILEKYVALYDFEIRFNTLQDEIKNLIEKKYLDYGFAPPKTEDVLKDIPYNEKEVQAVLEAILGKTLIKINPDIILYKDAYLEIKDRLLDFLKENGTITLGEFRDLLNTSRKYAVAILEYFDNNRVTKRTEDKRVLF